MVMTARELALWWHQEIMEDEAPNPDTLRQTAVELKKLRNMGITSDEFRTRWIEIKDSVKTQDRVPLYPWITKEERPHREEDNLLQEDRYLHPRLNTQPPPFVSHIDENTGAVTHSVVEFVKERIEYFDIEDLVDYYYEKFPEARRNRNRDKGAMRYMLKIYNLDKLLFIIDAAKLFVYDEDKRPPKSPLEIMDYDHEGISAYEEKMNYDS
jgi:hypothetical protein